MTDGAWDESPIVRAVTAAMALLMLPLILVYAGLARVAYPIALVVKPADDRPVLVRVPA